MNIHENRIANVTKLLSVLIDLPNGEYEKIAKGILCTDDLYRLRHPEKIHVDRRRENKLQRSQAYHVLRNVFDELSADCIVTAIGCALANKASRKAKK